MLNGTRIPWQSKGFAGWAQQRIEAFETLQQDLTLNRNMSSVRPGPTDIRIW